MQKLTSIFEIFLPELLGDVVEGALSRKRLGASRGDGVRRRKELRSMASRCRIVDEGGRE